MDLHPGAGPDELGGLKLDLLRAAVDSYLKIAYPTGEIPNIIRRRLVWPEELPPEEMLTKQPFERAGKMPGSQAPIYALRLGNHRYPHMKLQVQPWANEAGFMLSVNTHDQVAGLDLAADAEAFRELQRENQRLKEHIEQKWDELGLPTFLRYLRDYIRNRSELMAQEKSPGSRDSETTDSA
ncbi:MAG: hypothetical protein ACP5XB_00865 [Isosphaeraceae bacterium]